MNRYLQTILTLSLAALMATGGPQLKSSQASTIDDPRGLLRNTHEDARMDVPAVPGRLLVKYRAGVTSGQRNSLMTRWEVRREREIRGLGIHVIDLAPDVDVEMRARMLRATRAVEFVERDYILYPTDVTPDDPMFPSQWHLPAISCPAAWGVTTGSGLVTIAVCDTGVDAAHEDLSSKLVAGRNVVDNNSDTSPVSDHGTWAAGTAAAASNNGIGVASPAWGCPIMPIRVSSLPSGAALVSDVAAGVVWAADHGARVASVSFAGGASNIIADAGSYIQSRGGVLVTAAGNTGTYTSAPDSASMIVVSATDQSDSLAAFTTTGAFVDVSAPGSAILTTSPGNNYQQVSGTSFSAPLVAGAAALMLSVNPSLLPGDVDTILKVTADDLGPSGWDPGYGWGRLNVGRAVNAVLAKLNNATDVTPPAIGFVHPQIGGDSDGLLGISSAELVSVNALDDRAVTEVSLFADGVSKGTVTAAPYNFHWDTSNLADGSQHTLTAVAKDQAGNTTTVSTTVTLQAGFDATPPAVSFVQPLANGNVGISAAEPVSVAASDNSGAASVFLFADDAFVGEVDFPPYTFTWDTSSFAAGSQHSLLALAVDQAGNSTSASITVTVSAPADVTAPSVSFVHPQSNGFVGLSAAEQIEVDAQDNVGVTSVSVYADGTLLGTDNASPYTFAWDTTQLAVGSAHTLTATAFDGTGNSTTLSITVTVIAIAPQVSFLSPHDGEHITGNEEVTISASANAAVTRVDFFVDNSLTISWTSPPYSGKYHSNKLSRGSHMLRCTAHDAAGNSASSTITITVK